MLPMLPAVTMLALVVLCQDAIGLRINDKIENIHTVLGATVAEEATENRPALHVITFTDRVKGELTYLLATASHVGVYPQILGMDGAAIKWGSGLGAPKIVQARDFVNRPNLKDIDVVMFVDAYDVMIVADETEIMTKFLQLEKKLDRHIIFNAERHCFPSSVCGRDDYPAAPTEWRYLNSGAFMGRVGALRSMLNNVKSIKMSKEEENHDQAWYQHYYLNVPKLFGLDSECLLFCATPGLDPAVDKFDVSSDHRFKNLVTGNSPAVVHFPGPGHWPRPNEDEDHQTTWLFEAFTKLHPSLSEKFFGSDTVTFTLNGKSEERKLYGWVESIFHKFLLASNKVEPVHYKKQGQEWDWKPRGTERKVPAEWVPQW